MVNNSQQQKDPCRIMLWNLVAIKFQTSDKLVHISNKVKLNIKIQNSNKYSRIYKQILTKVSIIKIYFFKSCKDLTFPRKIRMELKCPVNGNIKSVIKITVMKIGNFDLGTG